MQYFGGKARIAKELSKELQSRLEEDQSFVDLFCGSCNIVSRIKAPVRIANDLHKELISLHRAVQGGWIPPSSVSEDEYKEIKNSDEFPDYLRAFVGFGCSFAGKWFGGYAKDNTSRNYCLNAHNSILCKMENLRETDFACFDYKELHPVGCLIYCDEIREMTDEEFAAHQGMQKNSIKLGASDDSE